ncbi:prepilin-type N-terminal cleavage/methylation domain-containing protein [Thiomicrorhabdus chilensis]|uniref:prepilin-type N-terminal cleavage/methylation domain-containing protein n=1 Tax=Thiomicrorhabdus chilensis TaxID=63656 RepID=UPI000412B696|nr:prepilin-type N-terminal cleavage/methylation domain-containing protein [Thiomicrorhabdus chilensis]
MKNVQTKLQNQKGFTLVEIAIVLVIIGLLLGGVLKGQELIENSKVKSVTQDLEGVSAAYWAYRDRTGSYPGTTDDSFWFNLKNEGFIGGTLGTSADSDGPDHALDGVLSYENDGGNGTNLEDDVKYVCASLVPNRIALNIDNKLDDGVATTGEYRSSVAYDADSEAGVTFCKQLK